MRKTFVRALAVFGVGGSAMVMALGSGCGGDDTAAETQDGSAVMDGTATDTSLPDVVVQDGNMGDSALDAGTDTGHPSFDAGAPGLATFNLQQAQIFCNGLASCCFGTDTSGFNFPKCATSFNSAIGVGWTGPIQPFVDGGQVNFDPLKAQQCFDDINGFTCGLLPSAQLTQMRADCESAVGGKIPAGSTGCKGSPECAPPAHCEIDGGVGTCMAPRAIGASCGGLTQAENLATCGTLISGVPGYCSTPSTFRKTNACEPQQVLDAGCNAPSECLSQICASTTDPVILDAGGVGSCSPLFVRASVAACSLFTLPDAGPTDAGPG